MSVRMPFTEVMLVEGREGGKGGGGRASEWGEIVKIRKKVC